MNFSRFLRILWLTVSVAAGVDAIKAQAPEFSLLTCGPGSEAFQLEGHTALRIQMPDGRDAVANWGVFDFNSPGFYYRFVKGETDYMVGIEPYGMFEMQYRIEGRSVTSQRLSLTDAQAEELFRLIKENCRPENRVYRYNYVLDNCATRPLALIEKALAVSGDSLMVDFDAAETTFRGEMRQYHRNYPYYQLFIDFALGNGIDRPVTLREQAFAPLFLERLAANAVIVSADGSTRPLVESTMQILPQTAPEPMEGWGSPMVFAILISVLTGWLAWKSVRRGRIYKVWYALFYLLVGLLGAILTFLIFVSVHEATSPNVNYFWLNPLLLMVPLLIWSRRFVRFMFWLMTANFCAVVAFYIALMISGQSLNAAFIPLTVADLLLSGVYIYLNRKCFPRK